MEILVGSGVTLTGTDETIGVVEEVFVVGRIITSGVVVEIIETERGSGLVVMEEKEVVVMEEEEEEEEVVLKVEISTEVDGTTDTSGKVELN